MASFDTSERRPLSPHLQVYKVRFTMVMSIMHRITGVALYFAILIGVWWLTALAAGPAYFGFVSGLFGSWFGLAVLFAAAYGLMHHLTGGVRHLIWDSGRYLTISAFEKMSIVSLAVSLGVVALVFLAGYAAS